MKTLRFILICFISLMIVLPVLAAAPDTEKIAYVTWKNDSSTINLMNPNGGDHQILLRRSGKINQLAWSPNGEKILFCADRNGTHDVFIMDADGSNVKPVFDEMIYKREPIWSPDGKQIAFVAYSKIANNYNIHIASADGNYIEPTIQTHRLGGDPSGSPDGTKIAYVISNVKKREIYVFNLETKESKRLILDKNPHYILPRWSPLGDKIAFYSSGLHKENGIYTVTPDGFNQKLVVSTDISFVSALAWAPNGKRMVYSKSVKGITQIFTVDIATGRTMQLTQDGVNIDPVWYDPASTSLPVKPNSHLLTSTWGNIKAE
ncbi:PD40 domain-containing protein [Candidatus Poribacteria bacterium]|nr:PD40 domain-containing protein [Candidatus Poribacteria bacterium]